MKFVKNINGLSVLQTPRINLHTQTVNKHQYSVSSILNSMSHQGIIDLMCPSNDSNIQKY